MSMETVSCDFASMLRGVSSGRVITGIAAEIDEDYLERLRFFFDDNLLLAALDLVDRDSGK